MTFGFIQQILYERQLIFLARVFGTFVGTKVRERAVLLIFRVSEAVLLTSLGTSKELFGCSSPFEGRLRLVSIYVISVHY